MSASDLLGQLRRLLGMEQAAHILPLGLAGDAFAGGAPGVAGFPPADAAQVDAMVLDLLAGANDAELTSAIAAAGPPDASREARWLSEEARRRGL